LKFESGFRSVIASEAKQSIFVAQPEAWIASSLTLLAMTMGRYRSAARAPQ
jgi:hypothetical protein